MEIKAVQPTEGAYVDTSIPKVAETPLEGSDAAATKTFGPFESDPAVVAKTPNSKGYSVHFEKPKTDPIEKAFDSIIMFIDDVREASSSPRGDGKGCMNAMTEALDATHTFDCVREPRNPCADTCSESFGKMQPPVDLMLNVDDAPGPVEEVKSGEYELKEASLDAPAPAKSTESTESASDKADKDYSAEEEDKEAPAKAQAVETSLIKEAKVSAVDPGSMMPTYSPVETIADKLRTSVPQDTLQMFVDTFTQMSGGAKADGAEPAAAEKGAESDPLVECIDRLILFFDDVQESLADQRSRMVAKKGTPQENDDSNKAEGSGTEESKEGDIELGAGLGGSNNTTMSEDTMKTTNALLDKEPTHTVTSEGINKAEEDYMKAVAHAEALLASTVVPGQKQEDSHKEALEKIMAEDETSVEAGKTNELKLEDLIKEADQAIMDTRSEDEADEAEEELVVLGHSATLTPIPEADEASAGASEEGVANGTAPEVPIAPIEQQAKSEANEKPEEAQDPAADPTTEGTEAESNSADAAVKDSEAGADQLVKQEPENEEQPALRNDVKNANQEEDPIVYFIDKIFLFIDDIQRGEPIAKSCGGCLGAAVPSDLVDQGEETVDDKDEKKEGNDTADENKDETPEDSRGQLMLQEALKLVKQANSDADDLADKLAVTFEEAEKAEKTAVNPDAPSTKMVGIQKKIITAHGIELEDNEQNRAIAKLVESAFAEKEKLRSAWNAVVGNPEGKGDEQGLMTPQMSDVDNGKQSKVEFEIPELMKQNEDPCIAWGGDDSELMASINADRKLSEMEHENIFRDVSKGLQESSAGIITRADNGDVFSIYNAPAFTEGNSGSNELPEDNPARAALKVLFAETKSTAAEEEQQPVDSNDATSKASDSGKEFSGWSLSKKREEMLRAKQTSQQ